MAAEVDTMGKGRSKQGEIGGWQLSASKIYDWRLSEVLKFCTLRGSSLSGALLVVW